MNIFIDALISNNDSLENFVEKDELLLSQNLGITYKNIKHKFLIGNDIPDSLRSKLQSRQTAINKNIYRLDETFSFLEIEVPDYNFLRKYYFKNNKLISSEKYHSEKWKVLESRYFIFHISDENLTNPYAIEMLDTVLADFISKLNISRDKLNGKKIHYFLCRDENEIEILTGYKSRGMCNLAYDYIISTYNNHYHELIHLLINLKLKEANLFVHPLLQEGFAVYLGGRGGIAPITLMNAGSFMLKTKFVNIKDFFSRNGFIKEDPSVSYPVAGLYTMFLFSKLKLDDYINLYKENSFDNPEMNSDWQFVPIMPEESWDAFLTDYYNKYPVENSLEPDGDFNSANIIYNDKGVEISFRNGSYHILADTDFLIKDTVNVGSYVSNKFKEFYPQSVYDKEHYLVKVSIGEISVYDLFINTLILQYSYGFDPLNRNIKQVNGKYSFCISANAPVSRIFAENEFTVSKIKSNNQY